MTRFAALGLAPQASMWVPVVKPLGKFFSFQRSGLPDPTRARFNAGGLPPSREQSWGDRAGRRRSSGRLAGRAYAHRSFCPPRQQPFLRLLLACFKSRTQRGDDSLTLTPGDLQRSTALARGRGGLRAPASFYPCWHAGQAPYAACASSCACCKPSRAVPSL